ncbi:hypothetical protein [Planctomicrobium piriforme]|uniref:Uncharacterized protein n=1 Tax=Planctomicrobium piriforme TaxID=1576369 RepID=A0A1I3BF27_9PLAN|nr:hypothetical protein [Planctomicrobium piriforme]SFH60549.1 hypothetical protein SAMN05421753_101406 [Planctomicrobium piriforme]
MTDNSFPPDLSSELPAPREEEPASLRQDILDELADHLACSLQRERVKTANERQAATNVLNRFGNPASIARKLWFDAMREKIMNQRLTMALMCVTFLVVSGLAVMMWKSLETSQATQAAMLERQQEFFNSLLTTIQDQKPAEKIPDGWAKLDVKLESVSGAPVKGAAWVEFTMPTGDRQYFKTTEESDGQGIIQLGLLPWGSHRINFRLPELNVFSSRVVELRPGSDETFRIQCPVSIPNSTVELSVTPPPEIRELPIAFLGTVRGSISINGTDWTFNELPGTQILFNSNGQILGEVLERKVIRNDGKDKFEFQFLHRPLIVLGNRAEFGLDPFVMISTTEPLLPQPTENATGPQHVILIPSLPTTIMSGRGTGQSSAISDADSNNVISIEFGNKSPYWTAYIAQAAQLLSTLKQQQTENQK